MTLKQDLDDIWNNYPLQNPFHLCRWSWEWTGNFYEWICRLGRKVR